MLFSFNFSYLETFCVVFDFFFYFILALGASAPDRTMFTCCIRYTPNEMFEHLLEGFKA